MCIVQCGQKYFCYDVKCKTTEIEINSLVNDARCLFVRNILLFARGEYLFVLCAGISYRALIN